MSPLLTYAVLCFGSLFSIVDPFAAVPIFLVLVGGQSKEAQNRIALHATLTCFLVLTAFAAAGSFIFSFFGITIPAFKVAGGILLFGVALDMMRAKPSPTRTTQEERDEAEMKEDIGLIPMGIPLLAGPGAIAATMVLAGKAHGANQRLAVHAAIFAVSMLTLVVLRSSTLMERVLGKTGLNVIGRVMGLILAALAVQFVFDGVREALPDLLRGAAAHASANAVPHYSASRDLTPGPSPQAERGDRCALPLPSLSSESAHQRRDRRLERPRGVPCSLESAPKNSESAPASRSSPSASRSFVSRLTLRLSRSPLRCPASRSFSPIDSLSA